MRRMSSFPIFTPAAQNVDVADGLVAILDHDFHSLKATGVPTR